MKNLIICCFLFTTSTLFGQSQFNDCVAACIDKVAIIKQYNKDAICQIEKSATGKLEIYTVSISETAITPNKRIKFKVGIRDAATQTIWLYSEATFKEIEVENILADCKKGDSIILLTKDKTYALPHNEILIL